MGRNTLRNSVNNAMQLKQFSEFLAGKKTKKESTVKQNKNRKNESNK